MIRKGRSQSPTFLISFLSKLAGVFDAMNKEFFQEFLG
jgi:hypothetical protein